jgi:hypothetical protein
MTIIHYNSQATGKEYIIKPGTGIQINMTMRSQALTEKKTKDMNSQLLKKLCLVAFKMKDKVRTLISVAMLYGRFGRSLLGRCRLYEELM